MKKTKVPVLPYKAQNAQNSNTHNMVKKGGCGCGKKKKSQVHYPPY